MIHMQLYYVVQSMDSVSHSTTHTSTWTGGEHSWSGHHTPTTGGGGNGDGRRRPRRHHGSSRGPGPERTLHESHCWQTAAAAAAVTCQWGTLNSSSIAAAHKHLHHPTLATVHSLSVHSLLVHSLLALSYFNNAETFFLYSCTQCNYELWVKCVNSSQWEGCNDASLTRSASGGCWYVHARHAGKGCGEDVNVACWTLAKSTP